MKALVCDYVFVCPKKNPTIADNTLDKIHDNTFTFLKPSQWFKKVVNKCITHTMITFISEPV